MKHIKNFNRFNYLRFFSLSIIFIVLCGFIMASPVRAQSIAPSSKSIIQITDFFKTIAEQFKAVGDIVSVLVTGSSSLAPATTGIARPGSVPVEIYRIGKPNEAFPQGNWAGSVENKSPQFLSLSDKIARVGFLLKFQIIAGDPEGDVVSYLFSPKLSGIAFDAKTGIFEWTPLEEDMGFHSFTVSAIDAKGKSVTKVIKVTVGNAVTAEDVDQDQGSNIFPPTLDAIENYDIVAGDELSFSLASYLHRDDSGSLIFFSATPLPSGATMSSSTGNFSWKTNTNQLGVFRITFRAVNAEGLGASQTMTVTVTPPDTNNFSDQNDYQNDYQNNNDFDQVSNTPPVISLPRNITIPAGTHVEFEVTAQDVESGFVLVTIDPVTQPVGSYFDSGTFSWDPVLGDVGSYPIIFNASDGMLEDQKEIMITVTPSTVGEPGNQPPRFDHIAPPSVKEGELLHFTVSATDANQDPLSLSAFNIPQTATFVSQQGSATGEFSWTPSYTDAGSRTITFLVTDGDISTATSTVITVENVNRSPVIATTSPQTVNENSLLTISLTASDPDGGVITYTMNNAPMRSSLSSNTFSWTPSYDQAGSYVVTFNALDNGGLVSSTSVPITVANINRPPLFTLPSATSFSLMTSRAFSLPFSASDPDSDPDADPVTLSVVSIPSGSTFDITTKIFSWTPISAGTYRAIISVSDSFGAKTNITITFVVTQAEATQKESLNAFALFVETTKVQYQVLQEVLENFFSRF